LLRIYLSCTEQSGALIGATDHGGASEEVKMAKSQIRAVAFQEGDTWVVQGVDHDVVAQTKDLLEAPLVFLRSLISTLHINKKLGRKGLEGIKPAPAKFAALFDNATTELTPVGPLPVESSIPRPDIKLRASSSAHAH